MFNAHHFTAFMMGNPQKLLNSVDSQGMFRVVIQMQKLRNISYSN